MKIMVNTAHVITLIITIIILIITTSLSVIVDDMIDCPPVNYSAHKICNDTKLVAYAIGIGLPLLVPLPLYMALDDSFNKQIKIKLIVLFINNKIIKRTLLLIGLAKKNENKL
jgi:hypothetical protein